MKTTRKLQQALLLCETIMRLTKRLYHIPLHYVLGETVVSFCSAVCACLTAKCHASIEPSESCTQAFADVPCFAGSVGASNSNTSFCDVLRSS